MKIVVWGLGRCGLVNVGCFAGSGNEVVGVDVDRTRVKELNEGVRDIREPGLAELLLSTKDRVRFQSYITADVLAGACLSLICVGTPSERGGGLDTTQVESVLASIAELIGREEGRFHAIVVRSTTPIGFLRNRALPIMSSKYRDLLGIGYGLATLPEFLREGSAIEDFTAPAYLIAGCLEEKSQAVIDELYQPWHMQPSYVTPEEAEALKLVSNAFHALKISFANEVGRACASLDVAPERIMELVCKDTRLNLSSAYLRPGAPFGGTCLSKDTEAFVTQAKERQVQLPVLGAIVQSNRAHMELCLDFVRTRNPARVGCLGLSFKPGIDDLRDSPGLELAKRLREEGRQVLAYDPSVSQGPISKSNRKLLENALGEFSDVLCSTAEEVVCRTDLSAIMHDQLDSPRLRTLASQKGTMIVNFSNTSFSWFTQ